MQVALQTITPYPPKGMCCVAWIGDALKDVLVDVLMDVLVDVLMDVLRDVLRDVLMCCIKTTNKKLTDYRKVLYKNNK